MCILNTPIIKLPAKLTTVKPHEDTTISILGPLCDGVHPIPLYSRYFIRRIRIKDEESKKKTIEDSQAFQELNKRIV